MMPHGLPPQLRYLTKTLTFLRRIPQASLNEDNQEISECVYRALEDRLHGMSPDTAKQTIQRDGMLLREWASQSDRRVPAIEYLMGFMSMIATSDMSWETSAPTPPRPWIQFDTPTGFTTKVTCSSSLELQRSETLVIINTIDTNTVLPQEVPGGCVHVIVQSSDKGFNEVEIESRFQTLEVARQ